MKNLLNRKYLFLSLTICLLVSFLSLFFLPVDEYRWGIPVISFIASSVHSEDLTVVVTLLGFVLVIVMYLAIKRRHWVLQLDRKSKKRLLLITSLGMIVGTCVIVFAMKQDARLLDKNIAQLGTKKYVELFKKHNVDPQSIDWFLPHISSEYFIFSFRAIICKLPPKA